MLRKTLSLLAVGLVAMAASEARATTTTALGQVVEGGSGGGGAVNLGFTFSVNSTLTVQQLLIYQGSLAHPTASTAGDTIYLAQIGGGGATTASPIILASVVSGTPTASGGYQYNTFTATAAGGGGNTVTLTTNNIYEVYATFAAANNQYDGGTTVPSSDVTVINSSLYGNPGNAPPTTNLSYNLLSTNFLYSTPNAVPEPASLAMLGLGLVGVTAVRRRMVRKTA